MRLFALFEVQKPKSFLLSDNAVSGMLCLEAGKVMVTRLKTSFRIARGIDKLLTTG